MSAYRLALATLLSLPAPALACLWDRDTLEEEAFRAKDVAEVVRGRVPRHSELFYRAKIDYTKPLVEGAKARPEHFDDLAVAYDRVRQYDDAIAVVREKERRFPGLYTTAANLGTFLAHAGRYDEALVELRRAIAINPGAHFGRERYQVRAIEYFQRLAREPDWARREDLVGVPLTDETSALFRKLVVPRFREKVGPVLGLEKDTALALAAIIRFGSGLENPHVWLALGNALRADGSSQLALRAYHRAQRLGAGLAAFRGFRDTAAVIPDLDYNFPPTLLRDLDAEWAAGEAWVATRQAKEDALVKAGRFRKAFGY